MKHRLESRLGHFDPVLVLLLIAAMVINIFAAGRLKPPESQPAAEPGELTAAAAEAGTAAADTAAEEEIPEEEVPDAADGTEADEPAAADSAAA